jgi:hypothetical protein
MLERVALEAAWSMGSTAAEPVRAAVAAALAVRDAVVEDDHDPRLLHPARTVLILLSDAGCRDAHTLAAAAGIESIDAPLRPPGETIRASAGEIAAGIAAAAPLPAAEEHLLEALVTAPAETAVAALAERLDHARHLHQRPDIDWPTFLAQIEDVYVPVALRLSPPLARRLERWAEAFRSRRLLRPGAGGTR